MKHANGIVSYDLRDIHRSGIDNIEVSVRFDNNEIDFECHALSFGTVSFTVRACRPDEIPTHWRVRILDRETIFGHWYSDTTIPVIVDSTDPDLAVRLVRSMESDVLVYRTTRGGGYVSQKTEWYITVNNGNLGWYNLHSIHGGTDLTSSPNRLIIRPVLVDREWVTYRVIINLLAGTNIYPAIFLKVPFDGRWDAQELLLAGALNYLRQRPFSEIKIIGLEGVEIDNENIRNSLKEILRADTEAEDQLTMARNLLLGNPTVFITNIRGTIIDERTLEISRDGLSIVFSFGPEAISVKGYNSEETLTCEARLEYGDTLSLDNIKLYDTGASADDREKFYDLIQDVYHTGIIVDNDPVTMVMIRASRFAIVVMGSKYWRSVRSSCRYAFSKPDDKVIISRWDRKIKFESTVSRPPGVWGDIMACLDLEKWKGYIDDRMVADLISVPDIDIDKLETLI